MDDFQGNLLKEGDWVALYYGYNELKNAKIMIIKNNHAKLDVYEDNSRLGLIVTRTKWKRGECMIKLHETQIPTH